MIESIPDVNTNKDKERFPALSKEFLLQRGFNCKNCPYKADNLNEDEYGKETSGMSISSTLIKSENEAN